LHSFFRTFSEKIKDTLNISPVKMMRRNSGSSTQGSSGENSSSVEERIKSLSEALSAAISSTELEACRRTKKEVECETLMEELIDMKLKYANVASELDVERARNLKLRDTLERYAQNLTTMEVKLADSKVFNMKR